MGRRIAIDIDAVRLTVDFDAEGHGVVSFSTSGLRQGL
jgi:hypothetical protein